MTELKLEPPSVLQKILHNHLAGLLRQSSAMQIENVQVEIVEGDARNVMCDAVEKFHASILVVGSHNYGVVKR